MLVDEGMAEGQRFPLGPATATSAPTPAGDIIDGIGYDGKQPNAYIDSLPIGLKDDQKVVGNQVQG